MAGVTSLPMYATVPVYKLLHMGAMGVYWNLNVTYCLNDATVGCNKHMQ